MKLSGYVICSAVVFLVGPLMLRDFLQLQKNNGVIHDYSKPARHCARCVFNMALPSERKHAE